MVWPGSNIDLQLNFVFDACANQNGLQQIDASVVERQVTLTQHERLMIVISSQCHPYTWAEIGGVAFKTAQDEWLCGGECSGFLFLYGISCVQGSFKSVAFDFILFIPLNTFLSMIFVEELRLELIISRHLEDFAIFFHRKQMLVLRQQRSEFHESHQPKLNLVKQIAKMHLDELSRHVLLLADIFHLIDTRFEDCFGTR